MRRDIARGKDWPFAASQRATRRRQSWNRRNCDREETLSLSRIRFHGSGLEFGLRKRSDASIAEPCFRRDSTRRRRERERTGRSIIRGRDLSEDRRPFLASSTTCDPPCCFVVRRGRSSSSLFCVRCEFLFGQPALCSTLIRGGEPFVRPNVGVVNTRTHQRLITFSTASLEPSIRGGLACKLFRAIFLFFSFFPSVEVELQAMKITFVLHSSARVKIIRRIISYFFIN